MNFIKTILAAFFGFLAGLRKKEQKQEDTIDQLQRDVINRDQINEVQSEQLKVSASNVKVDDAYKGLMEE